jgi:hypothetical protein
VSAEELVEWVRLGAVLREACGERYREIVDTIRSVVDAEVVAREEIDAAVSGAARAEA